ncbi:hypothetical protein [Thalassospira tepidiphila]|uniref:hypothetical protein n=1 Tax=Thalassospira tepidiphila TaxID=393657 RepID=UPI001BCE0085|nr:hypothetical protein [Thalassospira tepidiphila]
MAKPHKHLKENITLATIPRSFRNLPLLSQVGIATFGNTPCGQFGSQKTHQSQLIPPKWQITCDHFPDPP